MKSIAKAINGFLLPSKDESNKLKIEQFVGFLSRKSKIYFEFKNPDELKLFDHKEANNNFMSWIKYAFGDNSVEYNILNEYKSKIENLNNEQSKSLITCRINDLGVKLIEDYNYDYYLASKDLNIYNTKPQISLLKLEQLFIQYEIPSCYLEELIKPNANATLIYGRNAFNWINIITNMEIKKIYLLKEYLDEYFQYLLDKPKSILTINNLELPIKPFDRNQIEFTRQYASYLNRDSTVFTSSYLNNSLLIDHILSNANFMSWFRSVCNSNKEISELENYRKNIENLSKSVINKGTELIGNYDYKKKSAYTEKQQYLINLEQFLIRYNLPSEYVMDSIAKEKKYLYNKETYDWIYKITKNNKAKTIKLQTYLNEYFNHVFKISNDKNSNANYDFSIDKSFEKYVSKKVYNKHNTF